MQACPKTCWRHGIIIALAAVAGALATGCAPALWVSGGPRVGVDRDATTARPGIDIEALEQRIHQLANHERVKRGLTPLAWNPVVQQVARRHSRDMARRHYFAHLSPEGHDLAYRYSQQGFVCQIQVGSAVYMGSENIYETSLYEARDYVGEVVTRTYWKDLETIAQTIVKGWMSSPTHRQNLLEPSWQTHGIGIAISGDDRVYATQDFC